jgi:quinol monooxygenase YgiN
VSELWRDLQSLDQHLASDEFKNTLDQLAGVEILDRRVYRFNVLNAAAI